MLWSCALNMSESISGVEIKPYFLICSFKLSISSRCTPFKLLISSYCILKMFFWSCDCWFINSCSCIYFFISSSALFISPIWKVSCVFLFYSIPFELSCDKILDLCSSTKTCSFAFSYYRAEMSLSRFCILVPFWSRVAFCLRIVSSRLSSFSLYLS